MSFASGPVPGGGGSSGLRSALTVAAVQLRAEPGEIATNLAHAGELVSQATERGARLILLPELTPGGYVLTEDLWRSAETMKGQSVSWLRATANRLGVYLGMSFLEAEGSDFYNSFVLATPDGEIAGRVRKNPPASAEAYFYRGGDDPQFIDTPIGRLGVSICYEALLYERLAEHYRNGIDLLLVPASAATPAPVFPIGRRSLRGYNAMLAGLAAHHARALGVPVAMANKCGPLVTAMPRPMPFQDTSFPGLSTIADADGGVVSQLGSGEGLAVAEVQLDPARKAVRMPASHGRWALPVPWFSFFFAWATFLGARAYAGNRLRAERALAVSRRGD